MALDLVVEHTCATLGSALCLSEHCSLFDFIFQATLHNDFELYLHYLPTYPLMNGQIRFIIFLNTLGYMMYCMICDMYAYALLIFSYCSHEVIAN